MAVEKFNDALIALGERNYSGKSNQVAIAYGVEALDATVFGMTTKHYAPGVFSWSIDAGGFWDAGTEVPGTGVAFADTGLFPRIGSAKAPILIASKNADLAPCFFSEEVESDYSLLGSHGELNPFSLSCQSANTLCRGYLGLQPIQKVAAGNGSAFQFPAAISATQALVATLHVVQFNGTTLTMLIESDDNAPFSSATTRLTFAAATGLTSEFKQVNGPIATDDRYRCRWTFTGTSFTALVGFAVISIV
jgi:hypothetical protein